MFRFTTNASETVNGSRQLPDDKKSAILAIGNFDGVHKGHQYILKQALEIAQQTGSSKQRKPFGVITFSPHPRAFFNPTGNFFRLTDNATRADLFEQLGIDILVMLEFSKQLAALTAEEFVQKILVTMLGISHIIVGENFYFGKNRQGNAEMLTLWGEKYGFGVSVLKPLKHSQQTISSSKVRQALRDGEPALATQLLGHSWYLNGVVVEGKQLGRTIGFPTANIATRSDCELKHGTYAAQIEIDGQLFQGAGNYGTRPTVNGVGARFEIFIFDFDRDIYGKQVKIHLHKFIRDDEKFEGLEPLIAAIDKDVVQIKQYFAKNPSPTQRIHKIA
ncbi:MAG: bifunctional riboflavin kinase/FAD synthetase [Rhizobiales bacterium]|nr:bifunctional riboflavin kinase/FAD synthetase [Hyphomicrobiales bacterium]NRB13549.1 bifunctional riboflavin kinase/FAD synthetase [Hyphomicrobiales bacterium]